MKAENIIEYELFKDVIEHIMKNGGLSEISISGGEPFLHKDLPKMVKLCKSYGIKTNVYTSGIIENPLKNKQIDYTKFNEIEKRMLAHFKDLEFSFIGKERLIELKELGLDKLVFDFQASECDRYNEIMGTKGNLANLLKSMINSKSVGLCTEVHFIPMKTNYKDIDDILEICQSGEIDKVSILKFVPQGRGRENKENLELSSEQLKEFCENLEQAKKKYNVKVRLGIPMRKGDEHLCTAGHDKLSIRYDGIVLPCVAFKEMDSKELESIFIKNDVPFRIFSIKESLDMIKPESGNNKIPICKQLYGKSIDF
jgi:MoaA/NifB/PqqE/SkfB family radical SAM enzyme